MHATQYFIIMLEWFSEFFSHLLNYQHLYMNQIVHIKLIETIIQMLHITLTGIY